MGVDGSRVGGGEMGSSRRPRTTIGRLMTLNVVVALLLAGSRLGLAGLAGSARVLAWVWTCLLVALVVNAFLNLAIGIRCPSCRRDALRRLARPFSRVGYYECSSCGTRWKRGSTFSRWEDASGPEDAAKYRRTSTAGRWLGFAVPEDDDSTCGALLRSKRSRLASPAPRHPDTPRDRPA